MDTAKLKKFAQFARRSLLEQVSAKLKLVLADESAARREHPAAIKKLDEAIKQDGKEQVIERVAYIWFNRLCALRFMDVNRYNRVNIVSPADPGQFQPEILAEAKMGHIDEEMLPDSASSQKTRQQIFALLDGKVPSGDPQGEAYRLLVVATCNFWNKAMPFLFQHIDDYTELLMPDDLLSGNSILAYTREAMTPDACEDVEVIGWLYQFYISEKKDSVFEGLKKGKKITPDNIPAATQLFTPHWIVRYLVENSLGRLWMLNRPGSHLAEKMDYYIKPEQPDTDFLSITKPEEIKICDPACGSGHMLTYAFDLLYAIYEEEGTDPAEIPEKILTHNLYGIEIDERAGELAAFALTMKARAKQRRFFNKGIKPNICVLQNVKFDENELTEYMSFVGRDLFTSKLQTTLQQFEETDNFGSLIRPELTDVQDILQLLEAKDVSGQLFLNATHQKVLQALRQADYLSPKYHVVIANPPYMGSGGMNQRIKQWIAVQYSESKSDIYASFVERALSLVTPKAFVGMVTMQTWMFLNSFSALRSSVITENSITGFLQIGYNSFPALNSKVALACAFIIESKTKNKAGQFFNLNDAPQSADKGAVFLSRKGNSEYFVRNSNDFRSIPNAPLAFWTSQQLINAFKSCEKLGEIGEFRIGMATGQNESYVRGWHEVDFCKLSTNSDSRAAASASSCKWFAYAKGGAFRRWAGNQEAIVNWENDGYLLQNTMHPDGKRLWAHNFNLQSIFKPSLAWTQVTTGKPSFRFYPSGYLYDAAAGLGQPKGEASVFEIIGLLNSKVAEISLSALNPTINLLPGDLSNLPYIHVPRISSAENAVYLAQNDWDSFETSWDFTSLPLLNSENHQPTLNATYQKLRAHWWDMTREMQRLEEENNRIFIDAYGLQEELTPEVPLKEITLTCNPHYRYGNDKGEDELETLLLADTMRELVSYAVGCMFGRYTLDKPGLILANQGETIEDYLKQVPEPSFPADADNVIPMLDGDWFTDDITERFKQFLNVALGAEHYENNLRFVEDALGKDIRKYFLKDFYNDHVRRYKKRPIYWLFSSPKGSFNALIYMHRYRPDTVSVVLNDYLREFRTKLTSHKNHLEAVSISGSASQAEKTKALKEIEKLVKIIAEMEEYEREVLYPLATEQVEIDLDDGVKVNYPKLGSALKKIAGLDAEED